MSVLETDRFGLPLLATGQAHKELFHNEALSLIDFLLHPVVEAVADDPTVLDPEPGQSWLVGESPKADWSGRAGQIAGWSPAGWRYMRPVAEMRITVADPGGTAVYDGTEWRFVEGVGPATGGGNVDIEARAAIESLIGALQTMRILPLAN